MTDKIVNSQNSSFVSLRPTTQTTFTENGQMIFELDESLGYIKGRDSYLVLDVKNSSSDFSRWTFPQGVGASAMLKRVEIYSKSTGQLLETLDNYNMWCGLENQYSRDDFSSQQRDQGVGTPHFQYQNGYDVAGAEFRKLLQLHPSEIANCLVSPVEEGGKTPRYFSRRFCIPIKSGVFSRWWNEEKLCPVLNFGGLRMVFTFAPNEEVCKRLGFKPERPADNLPGVARSLVSQGIKCKDQAAAGGTIDTDEAEDDGYIAKVTDGGLVVGQKIRIEHTAPGTFHDATITDIVTTATPGSVRYTFAPVSGAALTTGVKIFVDTRVAPSYEVENAELRVLQMVVPKEGMDKLSKPMTYEFMSYDQFFNTLPMGVKRHQVPIPSVASKAKAVFSHFVGANNESEQDDKTYYSGLSPQELACNSLQLFVNNKLYPLQSINPTKNEDKPLMLNELVKAFGACNKLHQNLGSNEKGQLNNYSNTFLYARELARGDFVYDLQNAEPEVRMAFSATRTNITRINTFVFSNKQIQTSPNGLVVEL